MPDECTYMGKHLQPKLGFRLEGASFEGNIQEKQKVSAFPVQAAKAYLGRHFILIHLVLFSQCQAHLLKIDIIRLVLD